MRFIILPIDVDLGLGLFTYISQDVYWAIIIIYYLSFIIYWMFKYGY
jgi:hypothetical protein